MIFLKITIFGLIIFWMDWDLLAQSSTNSSQTQQIRLMDHRGKPVSDSEAVIKEASRGWVSVTVYCDTNNMSATRSTYKNTLQSMREVKRAGYERIGMAMQDGDPNLARVLTFHGTNICSRYFSNAYNLDIQREIQKCVKDFYEQYANPIHKADEMEAKRTAEAFLKAIDRQIEKQRNEINGLKAQMELNNQRIKEIEEQRAAIRHALEKREKDTKALQALSEQEKILKKELEKLREQDQEQAEQLKRLSK